MKKYIALLLSLGLLLTLLSSCEMFMPAPTEHPSNWWNSAEPAGEPGSSANPAENLEGGVDEYGFTVFPVGNYLADPKFDTDEFLPDYDADPSFIQFLSTSMFALCQTEDTIYASRTGLNKTNFVMYADKATGISGPLCGRPECLHNDSTCNAYVLSYADGLCVYDGKLYWANRRSAITRMNLDGANRETVSSVGSVYDNANKSPSVVIHRGYLYVAGSQDEVIVNGVPMGSFTINAMPLDGGEDFTILHKLVDGTGTECQIKPVGNDLYIMLYNFNYEIEGDFDTYYYTFEFHRWDSKTRQVEFISGTQCPSNGLQFGKNGFHPVPGDGIYFQAYVSTEEGRNNVIYKYSFETGIYEEGAWINGYALLSYCKDFIVTFQDRIVYTFDYNGNLLFTSDRVEEHGLNGFLGADSEFAYFYCLLDDHYIAVPLNGGNVIAIG